MPRLSFHLALTLVMSLLLCGCLRHDITIATETRPLAADDGYPLVRYRLMDWDGNGPRYQHPRGVVYYVQGSEDVTALHSTERLAGAAAMGLDVVMIERRGVDKDGVKDPAAALRYTTKQSRVADTLTMVRDDLTTRAPGGPVLLVGASEGGDIAAAVAAAEPRITHVVLLGSGGGWTQADELRYFVAHKPEVFAGMTSPQLESALADIQAHPDSEQAWLGHPYRRWSTFAFARPVDDLLKVKAPILLIQGDADTSVPVQSARAAAEAMKAAGKTNLKYLEYAGVDHRFTVVATGKSAFPRVEVDLVGWLRDLGALPAHEADMFIRRVKAAHPEAFR